VLSAWNEPGQWLPDGNPSGIFWSLGAGAAGAIGALGIILAFNYGGKPIYVMPLVFGGAPVINTFTTLVVEGTWGQVQIPFYVSLLMVILGAVTVLVFAPRPSPPTKPKPAGEQEPRQSEQPSSAAASPADDTPTDSERAETAAEKP
jgi:hypothetical protein